MNKLLILSAIFLIGCAKTVYVPTKEYIKGKDSIVIQKRDSIIYVDAHPQFNENITNQKSHLETDYSLSNAWIDSSGLLHHNIANVAKIPLKIIYKDVYKVKIDSVLKEKTVDRKVEVEKTPLKAWIGWILFIGLIAWKFRKKFGFPI
jgi:hypothetical protein